MLVENNFSYSYFVQQSNELSISREGEHPSEKKKKKELKKRKHPQNKVDR